MRALVALMLTLGGALSCCAAEPAAEAVPSFSDPPAKFTFQPFVKGVEPQTPGSRSRSARRLLEPKPWNGPLKVVIPEKGGATILAEMKGLRLLAIDVDGDQMYKGPMENLNLDEAAGRYGPTMAIVKYPDGVKMYYGFHVYPPPQGSTDGRWAVERAGAMAGKLAGENVLLIDDNSNGVYDDYGVDCIVIGTKPPAPLGQMLLLGGEVCHLKVSPAGTQVFLAKYAGKTGKLDLASGYSPPPGTKLASAVVAAGTKCFDLAADEKNPAAAIPEGTYELASGSLRKPGMEVPMLKGRMQPIEVKADAAAAAPKWGAPFTVDFKADSKILGITITEVGIYGAAGELYLTPKEPAPTVTVYAGGRAVHRAQMKYAADGRVEQFYFDPQASGKFEVEIAAQSAVFGKVTSGKREVVYEKKF
jgi:hypothetical protein